MPAALLTYTSNPTQVAISAAGSSSEVAITFLVVNKGLVPVSIAQIALNIPQGQAITDLIAANTTFTAGSVHSSDGSPWSLSAAANQVILVPVSGQGYAALAPGDSLQFTVSGLQINAVGAGQAAIVAVTESIHNGGDGSAQIPIQKISPGFYIESFFLDQYNVASGSPVTVTWKVVGALSCSVTAKIIQMASASAERHGPGCGVGTANPTCDGPIATGTDFSDAHTCNVQGATVFTLSAQGKGTSGDVTLSSQLLVTVNEPAIKFTGFPPGPSKGQSVTLKWISADAGKLQLYSLPKPGQPSIDDLTATPVGSKALTPLVDTNYFLYAYTNPGDQQPTTQSEFDVTVEQPKWISNLAVSNVPTPAYPGDAVTLSWALINVDYCDLTCDQPGFAPQNNLPIAGPKQVLLPDPGVANATATFTLTPVQFGDLGSFMPQTMTVPITNLPHFSQSLAANPASVAPGGSSTLTWAVDHADAAVLTSNLPGATPQAGEPAVGNQVVQIPQIVIPTPITYTLTASRLNQKYSVPTSATIQCTGNASVLWCRSPYADSGNDEDYLNSLYVAHPNQRIRKIQLNGSYGNGLASILVWYSDAANADFVIANHWTVDSSSVMTIPAGDYINSLYTLYNLRALGDRTAAMLWHVKLTTAGGLSIAFDSTLPPETSDGPYSVSIAAGNQAIALTWHLVDYGFFGGLGLVSCTNTYGQ